MFFTRASFSLLSLQSCQTATRIFCSNAMTKWLHARLPHRRRHLYDAARLPTVPATRTPEVTLYTKTANIYISNRGVHHDLSRPPPYACFHCGGDHWAMHCSARDHTSSSSLSSATLGQNSSRGGATVRLPPPTSRLTLEPNILGGSPNHIFC